jgi:hypothetical protein
MEAQSNSKPIAHSFDHLKSISSCPPPTATARDGTFFVFHDSNPPDEADFQTAAQRDAYPGKDECLRHSNSIWSDLEALRAKVKALKRRHGLRYNFISEGIVRQEHGVIEDEGGAHCSFWICAKHSMHKIFTKLVP